MDPFTAIVRALRKLVTGAPYRYDYFADHLSVRKKYVPFLHDDSFGASWREVTAKADERWTGGTPDIRWRAHVCIWAAEQCLRLDGDFAEFGVNTGLLSSMVVKETDFDASGKKFFLFDTYEGIPTDMASESEAKGVQKMNKNMYTGNSNNDNVLEFVQEVFAPHPGVETVRGLLPKSIEQASFEKLSYVSIDLNIASAEIGVIEAIWDRIVPGGLIILDDYGFTGHEEQNAAWNVFADKVARRIMSLPTGQGILSR
jgi:O-methyltransferase